ncbi:MAG: hypothetical protein ACI4RA_01030 [Kiritimatiellia bacterium]
MEDAIKDYEAYFRERGMGGDGAFPSIRPLAVLLFAFLIAVLAGYALARVELMRNWFLAVYVWVGAGGVMARAALMAYRAFRVKSGLLLHALLAAGVACTAYAGLVWFFLLSERTFVWGPCDLAARMRGLVETRELLAAGATVLLSAILFLRLFNRRAFFCGTCRTWDDTTACRLPPLYLRVPQATAYAALAKGDVAPLLSASPVPSAPGEPPHVVRVRYCKCRRGALWVARAGAAVPGLQDVPLEPDAVLDLLDVARHAALAK